MTKEQKQAELDYKAHLEQKRLSIMDLELNARYQKATWETMYYSIESDKIKPLYLEILEKNRQALEVVTNNEIPVE